MKKTMYVETHSEQEEETVDDEGTSRKVKGNDREGDESQSQAGNRGKREASTEKGEEGRIGASSKRKRALGNEDRSSACRANSKASPRYIGRTWPLSGTSSLPDP